MQTFYLFIFLKYYMKMFSAHAQRINTSPLLFTSLLAFTFPICLFYSKAKGWGKQNETYFPIHLSTHPAPPPPHSPVLFYSCLLSFLTSPLLLFSQCSLYTHAFALVDNLFWSWLLLITLTEVRSKGRIRHPSTLTLHEHANLTQSQSWSFLSVLFFSCFVCFFIIQPNIWINEWAL